MSSSSAAPVLSRLRSQGFSLIESAIVLAVIGLVIGGIWIAAAAVNERHNVRRAIEQAERIHQGLGMLFEHRDLPINTDFGSLLINSGYATPDLVSGTTIKNPWGGSIVIETKGFSTPIQFAYFNVPSGSCADLILGMTGQTSTTTDGRHGLFSVKIDGVLTPVDVDFSTFFSQITTRCKVAGSLTITLYYNFPPT